MSAGVTLSPTHHRPSSQKLMAMSNLHFRASMISQDLEAYSPEDPDDEFNGHLIGASQLIETAKDQLRCWLVDHGEIRA